MLRSLIPIRIYVGLLARYMAPLWPKALLLAILLASSLALQLVHPQIVRDFVDAAQQGGEVGPLYAAGSCLTRPAWSCRTDGRRTAGPTRSLFSAGAEWQRVGSWTSCWRPARR